MKLYHGTSSLYLDKILKDGLKPRGKQNQNSNWDHTLKSRLGHVYLTTAYAGYFALQAIKEKEAGLILEIDSDKLDQSKFYPDEDFIGQAQALRKSDALHRPTLQARTNAVKLEDHKEQWDKSLEHLGNCSYRGVISASAITRYCLLDFLKRIDLYLDFTDPTITVMNYRLLGRTRYGGLLSWLFEDRPDIPDPFAAAYSDPVFRESEIVKDALEINKKKASNREGITIVRINNQLTSTP